jgi:hypothetical protein
MPVGAAWKPDSLTAPALLDSSTYWLKSVATEMGERDVARPAAKTIPRLSEIILIVNGTGL